jgi:hypothetical protein
LDQFYGTLLKKDRTELEKRKNRKWNVQNLTVSDIDVDMVLRI